MHATMSLYRTSINQAAIVSFKKNTGLPIDSWKKYNLNMAHEFSSTVVPHQNPNYKPIWFTPFVI